MLDRCRMQVHCACTYPKQLKSIPSSKSVRFFVSWVKNNVERIHFHKSFETDDLIYVFILDFSKSNGCESTEKHNFLLLPKNTFNK